MVREDRIMVTKEAFQKGCLGVPMNPETFSLYCVPRPDLQLLSIRVLWATKPAMGFMGESNLSWIYFFCFCFL